MNAIIKALHTPSGFNPSSLSPVLYVNPYVDGYITTVDSNGLRQRGNIIDSATAYTGQALANLGTLASKPINNGEGWYFEAGAQMTTGSTSDYNFIHDGTDFDIWVAVFICPTTSTTYQRAFLCNNGFSTTARGILLRANASGNNRLECNIGNGTASFITLTANSALTVNATNIIRVRRSGSDAKMYVNGVQVATQTISLSPGVGNAGGTMTLAHFAGASANLYFKDLVIFNRVLTASEATSMNTRRFKSITPEPINVYLFGGDSNCAGRGLNGSVASDLVGNISGTKILNFPASYDTTGYIENLLLGKNHTTEIANLSVYHGAEMRFGKSMGAIADTFIIKYGIGSIPLVQTTAFGDWNAATALSYYNKFTTNFLVQGLNDLVHTQRRAPVFRGFIWLHGANDAVIGGTNVSWTRTGTTVTVTESAHGMSTGHKIPLKSSSDLTATPVAIYNITVVNVNSFTFQVVDAGATSGTLTYSAGSTYKANLTAVINGTIDYLTDTIKNQVTGVTGYTVNKLRLWIPLTKTGGNNFDTTSITDVNNAVTDIATNFLTDNPTKVGKVLGMSTQSNEDLTMADTIHYLTSGYDTIGQRGVNYFSPFVNE
jgi:hypothetical protein